MNILRLSTLSLGLAIAVFALGYVTPLQAQDQCLEGAFCDRDGDAFVKDHKRCAVTICGLPIDCDDSDRDANLECADTGDPQTTYKVKVDLRYTIVGEESETVVMCEGSSSLTKLGVKFANKDGCPIVLDGDTYCILQINVKNTKKETTAGFGFSTQCEAGPLQNELVYATGPVAGVLQPIGSGSFQIRLEASDVELTKIHQPNKGHVLRDKIYVGDLVYTEVP